MSDFVGEYLKDIPSNWDIESIDQVSSRVGSGVTPTGGSEVYKDDGIIFLRSQNIKFEGLDLSDVAFIDEKLHLFMKNSEVFAFDVLINITGASIGRCCFVSEDIGKANQNQHVCTIRLLEPNECDAKFVSSVLASPIGQRQILTLNAGGNREGLNYQQLRSFKLPWPNRQIRSKIALILKTIDKAIEKTEVLIHKYQQIKAGLIHDLFTRGLTADGKLRPPREQALELYQETPIGWIPKEWEVINVSDICYPVTKGTTPSYFISSNDDDSIPYIRVENLSFDGSLDFGNHSRYINKIIHNTELIRSKVYPGDILMNIVGPPLGKVSLIPNDYEEWNVNQAVAIFRVKQNKHTRYLLYYLLSELAQKWFYVRSKRTSGQVNLTLEMCSNLEIPIPKNDTELLYISNAMAQIFQKLKNEYNYLLKLKTQKSGLMHDLLSGKVQVAIDQTDTSHV